MPSKVSTGPCSALLISLLCHRVTMISVSVFNLGYRKKGFLMLLLLQYNMSRKVTRKEMRELYHPDSHRNEATKFT